MERSIVLQGFDERKRRLLGIAGRLRSISATLGTVGEEGRIEQATRSLEEERFDLAVFGRFKSGKSTFVNALLGEELLPMGVVPLTSIVTRVVSSGEWGAVVLYQDGRRERVDHDDLPRYITEKGNPENRLKVKEVEVSVGPERLKRGISIVDTPGTGSTLTHNTLATNEYIERADAGIFLFSADTPMGEEGAGFLRRIARSVDALLFVMNKIDRMTEAEWQEALSFSRTVIEKALGREGVEVHPLSSRLGLEGKLRGDRQMLQESRIPEFETLLESTLMREKGEMVLGNARRRLADAALDMRMAASLEMEAMKRPVEELERQLARLREIERTSSQRMREACFIIDGLKKEMAAAVNEDLEAFLENSRAGAVERTRSAMARIDRSLGREEYLKAASRTMRDEIVTVLEPFIAEQQAKVGRTFEVVARRFQEEADSIIGSAREAISESLALSVPGQMRLLRLDPKVGFVHRTSPVISYDLLFVGELQGAMPGPLLRRMVERRVLRMVPDELERNAGMFRYDLVTRLANSSERLRKEYQDNLRSVIETTENALRFGMEKGDRTLEEVERRSSSLMGARDELERVLHELDHEMLDRS